MRVLILATSVLAILAGANTAMASPARPNATFQLPSSRPRLTPLRTPNSRPALARQRGPACSTKPTTAVALTITALAARSAWSAAWWPAAVRTPLNAATRTDDGFVTGRPRPRSPARCAQRLGGDKIMSRHHILPPIVYTPAPPKPKKTERRPKTSALQKSGVAASDAGGEAEEASGVSQPARRRGRRSCPSDPFTPVDSAEHRFPSPPASSARAR